MRWAMLGVVFLSACRGGPADPPARPLRDFRGVIHVHSLYSHDSKGTFEEILAACKKRKIDFVCMSDHPPKGDPGRPLREGWRGMHDGVLFIQGAEYSDQILAVGIREPVDGTRQQEIDAIHAQGGLAFVDHPERVETWDFDGFDGMEIWNTHAEFTALLKDAVALARALKLMKKDREKGFLSILKRPDANLAKWDELNGRRPVTGIAGNDAHQNVSVMGTQFDPYDLSLGFVTTHVLAEELTEKSILEALRAGRAYVAFEFVAPAPAMTEWAPPPRVPEAEYREVHGRLEAARDGKPWIFWNRFSRR